MKNFLETLKSTVLISDGGMGSMVHATVENCPCVDAVSLSDPEVVHGIHLQFIQAGAQIIETNTFGANRLKLAVHGLQDQVAQINSAAVKIAREARDTSGREVYIAGSIGPLGLAAKRRHTPEERHEVFREQAEALEGRGVDLFILETFGLGTEVLTAAEAVREASSLPIVATLSFPEEWGDRPGTSPREHLMRLIDAGIDIVGMNCGMGPFEMIEILESLGGLDSRPIAVMPNAGVPIHRDGRYIFPHASPEYFARFARRAIQLGARIIGGCCGTRPEHVYQVTQMVSEELPQTPRIQLPPPTIAPAEIARTLEVPPSRLHRMLDQGEFVRLVQLDPPKGTETELLLKAASEFKASGVVDAVDINSNPMARLHLDSLWMAAQIERLGMETVPHITPRDATLMGLSGQLLGAWTQNIRTVLAVTGDPSQIGEYPGEQDVYQTEAIGLVRLISDLNGGKDWVGNAIGSPPAFRIGVAVNPSAEDIDHEIERFFKKVDNGATFAMTQVFFDWSFWEAFLDKIGKPPIPILVAVWPLTSYRLALRLHEEVPGIIVPEHVQDRLRKAGSDARKEGFDLAREIYQGAQERCAGVYVVAPFKAPLRALEVLE